MNNDRKSLIILVFKCLLLTAVYVSGLQAQETDSLRRVSGTVSDKSGALMPGVTVLVKGTPVFENGKIAGTRTDHEGKFSVSVPDENAILQFRISRITPPFGYAHQEIVVGMQREIHVVMREPGEPFGIETAIPVHLTEKQRERAESDNSFAFKMFREVSKQQSDNIFFSPFSLNMSLAMLYNGASDNTRAEMLKALGIANFSEIDVNEYYQKISQSLLIIDPITDINIANSIWYRDKLPACTSRSTSVKDSFIETGKKYFDADVQALDFNNPNAANMINKWCADKTNNRIDHIVDNPKSDDMGLYLINALYFKSKWQTGKGFWKDQTKLDDFTKTNQQKIKAYMMTQRSWMHYYTDQHLQCVELPYGNLAFSMIAILPSENTNINRLIDHLPQVNWQSIVDNMRLQFVWLKLPRFKIEYELPLNQPVMNLGMKQIFNQRNANLANIADVPLHVSNIKQKTFVEVNEEGLETPAPTAIDVLAFGKARKEPYPIHFFADRPFLFLIRENSTGVILLIGRVDEPLE